MADQNSQPPGPPPGTPPPVFNPVMGPVTSAIERDLARQSDAQRNGAAQERQQNPPPGSFSNDSAQRLEQARAKDRADNQARVADQSNPSPAQQQQNGQVNGQQQEPLLQPRRTERQQKNLRADDWAKINAERDQLKAQVEQLQRNNGQLPNMVANGQPNEQSQQNGQSNHADIKSHADYVALKQERDAFYEEIKHVRVEADPEFRAKFETKRDAAIRIAKSVSGAAGDDIARILAINDPDVRQSQLADRIKDFSEGSKQRVIAANSALIAIEVEREMEIHSLKASWDAKQSQRQNNEQSKLMQNMQKMDREFDAVAAAWSDPDRGVPFMYDQSVRSRVEPIARQIFNGNSTPRQLAEASLKAALFTELARSYQATLGELERLQGSNAAYRSSYPGSESGGFSSNGNGESREFKPISHLTYDRPFAEGLEAARQRDQTMNPNR